MSKIKESLPRDGGPGAKRSGQKHTLRAEKFAKHITQPTLNPTAWPHGPVFALSGVLRLEILISWHKGQDSSGFFHEDVSVLAVLSVQAEAARSQVCWPVSVVWRNHHCHSRVHGKLDGTQSWHAIISGFHPVPSWFRTSMNSKEKALKQWIIKVQCEQAMGKKAGFHHLEVHESMAVEARDRKSGPLTLRRRCL